MHAAATRKDDLFCQEKSSVDWKILKNNQQVIEPNTSEICTKNFIEYGGKLMMLIASIGHNEKLIPRTDEDIDLFMDRVIDFNTMDPVVADEESGHTNILGEKVPDTRRATNLESLKAISTKARNPQKGVGGTSLPLLAQGSDNESALKRINMDNHEHQTIKTKSMNRLGFRIVGKLLSYFASDLEYTLDDARVFIANPDPALFRSIFNLSDIPLVKNIRNIVLLDKIKFNLKFHFNPNLMERHLHRIN